ncbi:MAG: hypothetical protein AAF664_03400, partial [Planctomycetota bacterium]
MINRLDEACTIERTRVGLANNKRTLDPEDQDQSVYKLELLSKLRSHDYEVAQAESDLSIGTLVRWISDKQKLLIVHPEGILTLITKRSGRTLQAWEIDDQSIAKRMSFRETKNLMARQGSLTLLVSPHLALSEHDTHHDDHDHLTPLQRFRMWMHLERRDILMVVLFAFVSGVLTLATPLAVESLVNVVSFGVYLQPLIVLGILLLVCLGLAGILNLLQTIVAEIVQRRQ